MFFDFFCFFSFVQRPFFSFFLGHFVLRFFLHFSFLFFICQFSIQQFEAQSAEESKRCFTMLWNNTWVGGDSRSTLTLKPQTPATLSTKSQCRSNLGTRHLCVTAVAGLRKTLSVGCNQGTKHEPALTKQWTGGRGGGAGAIKPNCLVLSVTNLTREDPCLSTHLVANLMPASAYNRCRSEPGTPRSAHSPLHAASRCLRPSTIHS